MATGVGFILIAVGAFLRDCQTAFRGDSCGSTTVADVLQAANLLYYQGNAVKTLDSLMFLPFSYVALAIGAALLIGGGLMIRRL